MLSNGPFLPGSGRFGGEVYARKEELPVPPDSLEPGLHLEEVIVDPELLEAEDVDV